MTEPTNRSLLRNPYVYGAVAVLAAAGVTVAYLFGAFESRGEIKADDVCRNVPDRQEAAKVFNSLLPRAAAYDFHATWRPDQDWGFRSACIVEGSGDEPLLTLQATVGPSKSWQTWADEKLPPTSGKVSYFNAGIKGVSTSDLAAVYFPCYRSEKTSKSQYNMTVFAHALKPLEASDGEARQALIDLAVSLAHQAHKDAKCDLPSELPH
ncbi:hypothetical protein ACWCQK_31270 [Streptomyces sp. NPDC002306]